MHVYKMSDADPPVNSRWIMFEKYAIRDIMSIWHGKCSISILPPTVVLFSDRGMNRPL